MRRAGDKPISVDPASAEFLREVGADEFLAWTRGASILFPNAEEAAILAGSDDPETQCARLAARYPLVVVKRGAAGAEAAQGARRWRVNAPKIEAIDTTGAGDAFVAAFLARGCPARTFSLRSSAPPPPGRTRRRRSAEGREAERSRPPIDTIASFDRLAATAAYTYLRRQHGLPIKELPISSVSTLNERQYFGSQIDLSSTRRASMSIRPVKRISQSVPTMEGAGVKLRRAFGFGDTSDFDPFLMMDDFRGDRPEDYLAGFPVASPSRHRDDHLCAGGQRRSRRQPRQPRQARLRRRAVDDRRQRHPASGNADRRREGPHARLPALGEPARASQDDQAALPGRARKRDPRGDRRRRHARARHLRRVLGQERARSTASPPSRAIST